MDYRARRGFSAQVYHGEPCGPGKALSLGIHVCLGMEIIIVLFFILLERLNELVQVKHLDQFLAQWKATVGFIFVFISNEH